MSAAELLQRLHRVREEVDALGSRLKGLSVCDLGEPANAAAAPMPESVQTTLLDAHSVLARIEYGLKELGQLVG